MVKTRTPRISQEIRREAREVLDVLGLRTGNQELSESQIDKVQEKADKLVEILDRLEAIRKPKHKDRVRFEKELAEAGVNRKDAEQIVSAIIGKRGFWRRRQKNVTNVLAYVSGTLEEEGVPPRLARAVAIAAAVTVVPGLSVANVTGAVLLSLGYPIVGGALILAPTGAGEVIAIPGAIKLGMKGVRKVVEVVRNPSETEMDMKAQAGRMQSSLRHAFGKSLSEDEAAVPIVVILEEKGALPEIQKAIKGTVPRATKKVAREALHTMVKNAGRKHKYEANGRTPNPNSPFEDEGAAVVFVETAKEMGVSKKEAREAMESAAIAAASTALGKTKRAKAVQELAKNIGKEAGKLYKEDRTDNPIQDSNLSGQGYDDYQENPYHRMITQAGWYYRPLRGDVRANYTYKHGEYPYPKEGAYFTVTVQGDLRSGWRWEAYQIGAKTAARRTPRRTSGTDVASLAKYLKRVNKRVAKEMEKTTENPGKTAAIKKKYPERQKATNRGRVRRFGRKAARR